MIAVYCPQCNTIQHIKDQQNEQEYKAIDGPPCCRLSEAEARLLEAIFGDEFEQVTIKEVT